MLSRNKICLEQGQGIRNDCHSEELSDPICTRYWKRSGQDNQRSCILAAKRDYHQFFWSLC